jgi:hypothetical protein
MQIDESQIESEQTKENENAQDVSQQEQPNNDEDMEDAQIVQTEQEEEKIDTTVQRKRSHEEFEQENQVSL